MDQNSKAEQQAFVARFVRAGSLEPPPDLVARLVAVTARAEHRDQRLTNLLRSMLGAVAALGIVVAAPSLALGQDDGIEMHAAHELGSVQVALYCGLIAAAIWPRRARGVLMVLAAAAALLVVTAADDITAGRTTLWHETPHVIAVVGTVLVWLLARRTPEPVATPYRPAAANPVAVEPADEIRQVG